MAEATPKEHAPQMCRRCVVAGRVQGVGYRAAVQAEARRLGLCGLARNLADGRVEVVVWGQPQAVLQLCAWLWQGPRLARVQQVDVSEPQPPAAPPPDFSIA